MRRMSFEERRTGLIEAAIRVISRDGLAAASTRAITTEADMPLGAFHYVFESRDALLSAVIEEVADAERLAAWMSAELLPDTSDITALLREGLCGYLSLLEKSPEAEMALMEVALFAARHDLPAVQRQWEIYHRTARASLERAAELAGVTWQQPIDDLAHSLTNSVDGLTITWLATRDSDACRRHIDFLADSFARHAISNTN